MYHLTAEGPRLCSAAKRSCPLGGEHYEHLKEAETAFARDFSHAPLKKATFTEVKARSTLLHLQEAHATVPILFSEPVAFGPTGSRIYNLAQEGSDEDYSIVVGSKGKNFSKLMGQKDITVTSIYTLLEKLQESDPSAVALWQAQEFKHVANSSWAPMLESVTIDKYAYLLKLRARSNFIIKSAVKEREGGNERWKKSLKIALRDAMVFQKTQEANAIALTFSPGERVRFYNALEELYALENKSFRNIQRFIEASVKEGS